MVSTPPPPPPQDCIDMKTTSYSVYVALLGYILHLVIVHAKAHVLNIFKDVLVERGQFMISRPWQIMLEKRSFMLCSYAQKIMQLCYKPSINMLPCNVVTHTEITTLLHGCYNLVTL